jgi:hypothetical protein
MTALEIHFLSDHRPDSTEVWICLFVLFVMSENEEDDLDRFFAEAHTIMHEAQLIVSALPNVDPFAAERSLRKLATILIVLHGIHPEDLPPDKVVLLIELVNNTSSILQGFLDSLEGESTQHHQAHPTPMGNRGRPRNTFDLPRALELHNMGNSWNEVAGVLGVCRRTLYRHLTAAGYSRKRPDYDDICDEDLDDAVAAIAVKHPYSGQNLIRAHLAAAGILVPVQRVQASLRRVDAVGVLMRYYT